MAEQQKKKTSKKKKPLNKAFPRRQSHPTRVLRNVLRSNGRNAAMSYAQKYGLTKVLDRLVATSNWARKRMDGRPEGERPVRMRVGRALRVPQRKDGKLYLESQERQASVYAEALAMAMELDAAHRQPQDVVPAVLPPPPTATRKASVKRSVKTKAKAKVTKRRK